MKLVKVMTSSPQPFFPEPDIPPTRPERFPEDYEDDLEENCFSCGKQFGIHSTKDIMQCALNELRGESPKG